MAPTLHLMLKLLAPCLKVLKFLFLSFVMCSKYLLPGAPTKKQQQTKLADKTKKANLFNLLNPQPTHHLALVPTSAPAPTHASPAKDSTRATRIAKQQRSPARTRGTSLASTHASTHTRSPPKLHPARATTNASSHVRTAYSHTHKYSRNLPRAQEEAHSKWVRNNKLRSLLEEREKEREQEKEGGRLEKEKLTESMRAELARQEEVKRKREERKVKEKEEQELEERDVKRRKEERERKEEELQREFVRLHEEKLQQTKERLKEDWDTAVKSIYEREKREEIEKVDAERDKENEMKLKSFLALKRHLAYEV